VSRFEDRPGAERQRLLLKIGKHCNLVEQLVGTAVLETVERHGRI
jgi:hypothetical protein